MVIKPDPNKSIFKSKPNPSFFNQNKQQNKKLSKTKLSAVPSLICTYGEYNNDYKIIIGDRGCNIHVLKRNNVINTIIIP